MTPYSAGFAFGQIILLLTFLIPAFLFLRTQQTILSAVRPENRKMHPGLVWLQLIPFFTYVWSFIVVRRIADSLAKQYAALQSDSIFGIVSEEELNAIGKRPTYGIGLAYCLLLLSVPGAIIFFNLFGSAPTDVGGRPENAGFYMVMALSMSTLVLAMMICWIIYWVQLARHKKNLKRSPALA